jgi:glucose/arabinose dehydrogenase
MGHMRLSPHGRSRAAIPVLALTLAFAAACGTTVAEQPAPSAAAAPPELQRVALEVPPGLDRDRFAEQRFATVPPGWSISLWAAVEEARHAAWAPDGALLVSRPEAGEVVRLTGRGAGPATSSVLLGDLRQPHGLAFDGDTLYVAESDKIRAYAYADGAATDGRTLVDGLPDAKDGQLGGAYAHALKSLALGQDGSLFFHIGSSGNITEEDRESDPEAASVMRIPPGGGEPEVYARGVRNGTALAVAPDGALWTAVNGRDDIAYPYDREYPGSWGSAQGEVLEGYVADHPAEPVAKLFPGRDLGWPYCNPDPDVEPGVPGTPLDHTAPPFVADFETNPDGSEFDCGSIPVVEQSVGAHSAPLGMSFVTLPEPYGEGALLGIHGSWNRTPPRAPEVSFMRWEGGTLGPQETLVGGFQFSDGKRWGRPVTAIPGPDGAVYITDDDAGAVYRLAPPGL